jgi:enoyl-CoA hydratase/carnithine racemase
MGSIDLGSKYLAANVESSVLKVVINRPERRNAMTMEMYNGIKKATVVADNSPDIDLILITGVDDTFCVGGDMGGQHEETKGRLAMETDVTDMLPFRHLERCSKLIVTAVNGLCYAGGLDIVLCGDVSIASDRARFRAPEIRWGIADSFLAGRLPRQVGVAAAKYLIFTCAVIDAKEAAQVGLVGKVVPHEELESHTSWVVEQIVSTGPAARSALKKEINSQASAFDPEIFVRSIRSGEASEGMTSFVEKRPAKWPRT